MTLQTPDDHYAAAGGITTRYWVLGTSGPPVVMIHGLGASAEIWLRNINPLAERHQVYVPDLIGFGRTDKPSAPDTAEHFIRFIDDFLNVMKLERCSLVGHSLGGGIALRYVLRFPERVDRLALVDSAGLGPDAPFILRLFSLPHIGELLTYPSRPGVYCFFRQAVHHAPDVTKDFIDHYYRLYSLPGAQSAFLKIIRSITTIRGGRKELIKPVLTNLHRITHPTLVIWGQNDRILPVKHAYVAKNKIPNSTLRIFKHCGHMPHFECSADFNRLLIEFLAE